MAFEPRTLRQYRGDVDKSLFASKKPASSNGNRTLPTTHVPTDSVVLSRNELLRMQGAAVITTQSDLNRMKEASVTQRLQQTQAAQLRKERMLQMERDATRRKPLSEGEHRNAAERDLALSRARQALDEELDDVKKMNQMAQYAKCVTIRDQQLLEKQQRREEDRAEQRRLDTLMEIERVRATRDQDERDRFRAQEQRLGAAVIIQQMKEREADRIRQEEARAQEAQAMVLTLKELERKAELERLARAEAGKQHLAEIRQANSEQARLKLLKKQEEVEEDIRIAEYVARKEARELQLEEEAQRVAQAREREVVRLRALQERAQDRRAQIDELRARRYQEQKDRAWRDEQLSNAERAARTRAEVTAAREEQRLDKAMRMAEQALQEREEYERNQIAQEAVRARDAAWGVDVQARREAYRVELKQQVDERARTRFEATTNKQDDSAKYNDQNDADRAKLLRIKQAKLAELEQVGVPSKYRAQLSRHQVLVSSIHP
jgi:hypothetical protein